MMAGHSKKPQRQEAFLAALLTQPTIALAALLTQPTIALAAKMAGISEGTAGRWLKDQDFQVQYQEAKRRAFEEALSYLQQSMLAAVMVLRKIMLDGSVRPSTQVTAASKLLELGLRAHEQFELEQRIVALEATLGGKR